MVRALVVFESLWGNTEAVARAVADGLGESCEVEVADIGTDPSPPQEDVDLLVAGGPTHAFSMSRPGTREDARTRGATQGLEGPGLREWLGALPGGHHHPRVATFDTRVGTVRHLPGSAAKGAQREARRHGYRPVARESFWVDDVSGPLAGGELDRATAWGRTLAASVATVAGGAA